MDIIADKRTGYSSYPVQLNKGYDSRASTLKIFGSQFYAGKEGSIYSLVDEYNAVFRMARSIRAKDTKYKSTVLMSFIHFSAYDVRAAVKYFVRPREAHATTNRVCSSFPPRETYKFTTM